MEEASGNGNVVNFSNLDELSTKEIVSQDVVNAILEHNSIAASCLGSMRVGLHPGAPVWAHKPL